MYAITTDIGTVGTYWGEERLSGAAAVVRRLREAVQPTKSTEYESIQLLVGKVYGGLYGLNVPLICYFLQDTKAEQAIQSLGLRGYFVLQAGIVASVLVESIIILAIPVACFILCCWAPLRIRQRIDRARVCTEGYDVHSENRV